VSWAPLPPEAESVEPRPVGASLDRVAEDLGVARPGAGAQASAQALRDVFSGWAEVVGDHLARHARPVALRRGVLILAVDNPAWVTELRYLEADLLQRIDDAAPGVVERVELRVRRS
jgi:predicted nucleic acid-binding Zn ribbon protein